MIAPPMGQLENAQKILTATEASLRELIESALSQQLYADVADIARMADAIARLRGTDERSHSTPLVAARNNAASNSNAAVPSASQRSSRTARAFPRFEREGDRLVKIAWSKKDRAEYEHKAPHRIVDLLVE